VSEEQTEQQEQREELGPIPEDSLVWILVDHSARAEAFASVAGHLQERGARAEIVTITEVIGTMARGALAGSAERLLRGLRVAVQGHSDEDLIGAVSRVKPDLLAVTNPRHVRALSVLEGLTGIPALQVGVMPDFNLHDAWLKSGLHAFIVPHEELAARFERAQVPADRVLVAGPAVQPGYARELDKEALRDEFGFSTSEKLVIARAENFDVASLEKMMFQAKLVEGNVRFLFHHNGDNSAAATLRRAASDHGFDAVMFGRVDQLERYLAVGDMVITTANDPMMPEISALGLPVMMVGDPGDASAQAAFFERHELGRHVSDMIRLGAEVERFLLEDNLTRYADAARSIGLPGGSKEVAEAMARALIHAPEWRQVNPGGGREEQGGGSGQDGQDDNERRGFGGPFESIGGSRGGNSSSDSTGAGSSSGSGSGASGGGSGGAGRDVNEFVGISKAEAKEQLAQLILAERELDRKLGELGKEQQRWRNRLDLAREWNEDDLAEEAEGILRGYLREAEPLQQELQDVRRQKAKLKEAAGGGGRGPAGPGGANGSGGSRLSEVERRFRKMEEDRELDSLRDKISRELGE
jgi:hypothetical protein